MANSKTRRNQVILVVLLIPLLALAGYSSWQVYNSSQIRGKVKNDFSEINGLEYGILSANAWKDQLRRVAVSQIEEFELSQSQDSLLKKEVENLLIEMINEADSLVQNDDDSFKEKVRKWGVNLLVDMEDLKSKTPHFAEKIVNEATKPENKKKIKSIAVEKINEFAEETYDDSDSLKMAEMFAAYSVSGVEEFNEKLSNRAERVQETGYNHTFVVVGVVLLFLLPWFIVYKREHHELRKPLFILSVTLAIIVLAVGLMSAMIEIDARIKEVDFVLLGESIVFRDQIIFYRSKSILEVVQVLMSQSKLDSIFVGFLILAFSVILPVSKLISTEIYLLGSEKIRKNKFLHWLAIKSGKWSMADVMVVAIFMAYVGFKGILDSQLEPLNMDTQRVTSIATNLTSLQPGFILFLTFVLYGLILSEILRQITRKSGVL